MKQVEQDLFTTWQNFSQFFPRDGVKHFPRRRFFSFFLFFFFRPTRLFTTARKKENNFVGAHSPECWCILRFVTSYISCFGTRLSWTVDAGLSDPFDQETAVRLGPTPSADCSNYTRCKCRQRKPQRTWPVWRRPCRILREQNRDWSVNLQVSPKREYPSIGTSLS